MTGRQKGMYSTADAVIRTWVVCGPRAVQCEMKTEVVYRWGSPSRFGYKRVCERQDRTMRALVCDLQLGDRVALRAAWDLLFDYVAAVQLNAPVSMAWRLELAGLRRCDGWLLGVVQALVEVVGSELGVTAELVR